MNKFMVLFLTMMCACADVDLAGSTQQIGVSACPTEECEDNRAEQAARLAGQAADQEAAQRYPGQPAHRSELSCGWVGPRDYGCNVSIDLAGLSVRFYCYASIQDDQVVSITCHEGVLR